VIKAVDEKNIDIAARIHSKSWQESHKSFCNPDFVAKHTPEHQKEYLVEKIRKGTALYMLFDEASGKKPISSTETWALTVMPKKHSS
jgi:hypothetical protein